MLRTTVTTLTLLATLGGCYDVVSTTRVDHPVRITADPPHAELWWLQRGKRESLGRAPQGILIEVKKEKRHFRPFKSWIWTTSLGVLTGACTFLSTQLEEGAGKNSAITCAILAGLTTGLGLWATISGHANPVKEETLSAGQSIVATAPGYADRSRYLKSTHGNKAHFVLQYKAAQRPSSLATPSKKPPILGEIERPIVAVFDVQLSGDTLSDISGALLSTILHSRLAESGRFRLIPRSNLRKQLAAQRRESYKHCYDESCQIEIGKALAAQKSLAPRLLVSKRRCLLSTVLYDLKTETSEAAAVEESGCGSAALLAAIQRLVKKLSGNVVPAAITPR